jgi:hypothetical protein
VAKKVFVHKVEMPPPGETVAVDIYVDNRGEWSASWGENKCETKDLNTLKKWIDDAVRNQKLDPVKYAPFIEIWRPCVDDRACNRRPTHSALVFDFDVLLLSVEVYETPDYSMKTQTKGQVKFRRRKGAIVGKDLVVVDDPDWTPRYPSNERRTEVDLDDYERDGSLRSVIIPYTPQRYLTLLGLSHRINELRERLDALLVQSGDPSSTLDRAVALLPPVSTTSDVEENES